MDTKQLVSDIRKTLAGGDAFRLTVHCDKWLEQLCTLLESLQGENERLKEVAEYFKENRSEYYWEVKEQNRTLQAERDKAVEALERIERHEIEGAARDIRAYVGKVLSTLKEG